MEKSAKHTELYRRIWRWHFFAGLFVVPFAVVLAITGTIYLFESDIEQIIDQRIEANAAVSDMNLPADELLQAAITTYAGAELVKYIVPEHDARSVRILIRSDNQKRLLWIDQSDGAVLQDVVASDRLIPTVTRIHSSLLAGQVGNRAVELAASLMIILILSGIWLHWPRGRSLLSAVMPNVSAKGRSFWKSLHGAIGLVAGVFILGLILTGLPWTGVWGAQFSKVRTAMGWTGPGQEWFVTLQSSQPPNAQQQGDGLKLWSTDGDMGQVNLSSSAPQQAGPGKTLDWVALAIETENLPRPVWIQPPQGENGVWTVRAMPATRHLRQTLHYDKWTGTQIMRIRFADYHPVEKAMGHGLSFHEGALFGVWNKILGVLIALSIIGLSCAGIMAWLKRRPAGRLAAPNLPKTQSPLPKSLIVLMIFVLLFLPVAGIAVAIVWALSNLVSVLDR